jgi:signal transduction histidine kinase
MNIKQVQRDTLGFILYEDATFEHLSAKQLTGLKATQSPYAANCIETPDMICKAFEHGTYSKIEEFLKFQDRLENSYWRYRSDAEIMRLEMLLDKKTSAKLEQSKRVYDNRSKDIVLGCLPPDVASTWPLSFSGPSNPEGLIADADLKDLHEYQAKVQAMRDLTSSLTQNTDVAEDNKDSLLMALRDLSISGKAKNQDNLRQLFEEIVLTAEEAPHDRELLQSTGSALEKLKMAANALNGLKKSQRSALASIVQLLRNKLASLMSILESQRRRVVQSTSTLVAEVRREDLLSLLKNADESYVEQIVERVATAQTESLFALSNVAKNIRI